MFIVLPIIEILLLMVSFILKDQKNTTISGAARNPKNPLHKYLQFVNFDLSIPDVSNRDRYHLRRDILNKAWLNATSSNLDAIYIQF